MVKFKLLEMMNLEQFYKKGYLIIENVLKDDYISSLKLKLDKIQKKQEEDFGVDKLELIGEKNMVRCPFVYDYNFLSLIDNPLILKVCEEILGSYFILSLQNAIIIPPNQSHHQSFYHRDIIHQDFTSSSPLGVNVYYCLDDYTPENGGTIFLEGSHLSPFLPKIKNEVCPKIKKGSVILFDSMIYHKAGVNSTNNYRYGINHMFTLPFIKQQFNFPSLIPNDFSYSPSLERILGYKTQEFTSVNAFRNYRLKKIKNEMA